MNLNRNIPGFKQANVTPFNLCRDACSNRIRTDFLNEIELGTMSGQGLDIPVKVEFLKLYENVRAEETGSIIPSIPCMQIYVKATKHCRQSPTYRPQRQRQRYECVYCSNSYCRKSSLTNHLLIHTGEGPFKCDQNECNFTFRTQEQLNRHSKIHRNPYNCVHCQKSFSDVGLLNRHLIAVHDTSDNSNLIVDPMPGPSRKGNHQIKPSSDIRISDTILKIDRKFEDSENSSLVEDDRAIKQEVIDDVEDISTRNKRTQRLIQFEEYPNPNKGRLFTCVNCNVEFCDLFMLEAHTKKVHPQIGIFVTTGLLETIKAEPSS